MVVGSSTITVVPAYWSTPAVPSAWACRAGHRHAKTTCGKTTTFSAPPALE